MAWIKRYPNVEVGEINSAGIFGSVHRQGDGKRIYTFIHRFCLDLGALPLGFPLD